MSSAPKLTAKDISDYQKFYLVSFWVEILIYGVYLFLFTVAMKIMVRSRASNVILVGTVAMFLVITYQILVNLYSIINAYGRDNDPVVYLRNLGRWDIISFPLVCGIVTWIGDIIVIYRCWLIWNKRYAIIAAPVFLLVACIGTTSVNFYWFGHLRAIPWTVMDPLLKSTYPINFVQNLMTTCLITHKIYSQHRISMNAGHRDGMTTSSGLDLMFVVRIMFESAAIYTLMMGVLIVLFYVGYHPSQVIVQHAFAPMTGIVFVMVAVRTHIAKHSVEEREKEAYTTGAESICPTWLSEEREGESDHPLYRSHNARTSGSRSGGTNNHLSTFETNEGLYHHRNFAANSSMDKV